MIHDRECLIVWVTAPFLHQTVWSQLIPWPTACETQIFFCWTVSSKSPHQQLVSGGAHFHSAWQSYNILSHDQQYVSASAFFLLTIHSITNRESVTAIFAKHSLMPDQQDVGNSLWHDLSLNFIPWPTGSEWQCHFLPATLITAHPMTISLWVTLLQGFFITSHSMANSLWVTVVNFPWNSQITHDKQQVSDSVLSFYQVVSSCHLMTNSLWVTEAFFNQIVRPSVPMTNSKWVMAIFFLPQSYHEQQQVGDSTFSPVQQAYHISTCDQ